MELIPAQPNFQELRYTQTKRAWSPELGFHQVPCGYRIVEGVSKQTIKKLFHKRHGQNRQWYVRQMINRLQQSSEFLKQAANEMFIPVPDIAAIPSFGEKYYDWVTERKDRKLRNMQKKSRRVNRG